MCVVCVISQSTSTEQRTTAVTNDMQMISPAASNVVHYQTLTHTLELRDSE